MVCFCLICCMWIYKLSVSGMGRRDGKQWASFKFCSPGDRRSLCLRKGANTKESSFMRMAERCKKHDISVVSNYFIACFVILLHHLQSLMHTLAMCSRGLTQWLMSTLGINWCRARAATIMNSERWGSGDSRQPGAQNGRWERPRKRSVFWSSSELRQRALHFIRLY